VRLYHLPGTPACALSCPVAPRWQPPIHCGAPDKRIAPVSAYEAQLGSRMWSLSKASSKIAFGASGSCTPFQSRWVVSWPAATEPSLAVKSIVVVKIALPFDSF
jgi:hypothetical protein